jgi:hypothetical protein
MEDLMSNKKESKPEKIPNAETIKAIREVDAGKGKRMSLEEIQAELKSLTMSQRQHHSK